MDFRMPLSHTPVRPPRKMIEEQVFARRWEELMSAEPEGDNERSPLEYVLFNYPAAVDQRAASVAASLICWLGTNAGQSFLGLGRSIHENTYCKHEAYVAAWGAHNLRRYAHNSNARSIEFLVRTTEEQAADVFPEVSSYDLEVLDQVALWLGCEEGQAFVQTCETEISRWKDMERLGEYQARGLSHLPHAKELAARFVLNQ
jgi:hypothetical protein